LDQSIIGKDTIARTRWTTQRVFSHQKNIRG